MRIKKLELFGFKSFKDRTVIQFDAGITGIVGPNGCGKSNIVDALVWVMGEMSAKHLRGSNMSDVIFAGADGFAPMGMAEVNLVLENDGGPFPAKYLKHSEVMVTRRLHKSGESEYLINKEPARLRDIQEIFMDTGAGSKGFSIIEQGRIGEIITAKPEQRRTLIEEAAGITKFKVRKRESQRKLQQTDQNLVRLQDIIGEQKRQLDSLQRQAQRAERYRNIKVEMEEKELWLNSKKYLLIHEETEVAQTAFDEAQVGDVESTSQLSEWEAQLEEIKTNLAEKENAVQEFQRQHYDLKEKVTAKENEHRELKFEIEQARRNKEMTGSILDKYQVRKEALSKDQLELENKISETAETVESLQAEFQEKNTEFQAIQARIEEADKELTDKRREMLTVSQSESHLDASLLSIQDNLQEKSARVENERAVLSELEIKRQEFEKHRKKVFNELEQERQLQLEIVNDLELLDSNRQSLETQVENRQNEVASLKDDLNEVSSRLYGLEDLHANFEGFQEGVKNVMMWQRQKAEHSPDGQVSFRPVAELIEVPKDYELVMEAALGAKLQLLLSESSDETLSAVDYLKESNSGRSSFLSMDKEELVDGDSLEDLKEEPGVLQFLSDVVNVPENHRHQVAHVLSGVVIVDSIRTALKLRPFYRGKTFVTMDGDSLSADGVLTGGTAESAQSGVLKRRREIKELSMKREEAAGKLSLAQATLQKQEEQLKKMIADFEAAKTQQVEKERLIVGLEKDFERAENELSSVQTACSKQNEQLQKEEQALLQLTERRDELSEKIQEIRERKLELETQVDSLTQELESKKEGIDELQERVSVLRVESASKQQELSGLNHQMEMLKTSLDEVDEQLQQMSEETEKSTESLSRNQILVEQAQVELERLIREAQEAESLLGAAKNDYEESSIGSRELEQKVSQLLHQRNAVQSKMNEAQLKLEQLRMKEQYLIDQVNEKYMKDLPTIAAQFGAIEGNVKETEEEVENLKGKLKRIGEVNLSAIEEYDDLINRYEFLKQQQEDLTEAKEQLRKVIDKINRICSRRFKDTFEQVNERFEKVFPVLFGGGHARLILVEDPEKGEMGIDIIAQPPGKKAANVSLLSGGEKALTAVSLIFSIFLVKPSPFCLLDEVDAPLDDANVHRFNDLVKEMAKRSQIILVTHNKHTMKVNNKLFGVTQENKGVSKLVSVSLEEAQKVAES